jgi:hypothetical protein
MRSPDERSEIRGLSFPHIAALMRATLLVIWLGIALRAKTNFLSQFNAICSVQPLPPKHFPSRPPQISIRNPAVSSLTRGVSRSSRTRGGMRWTQQRQAREVVRRAVIRERTRRARRTALKRTAKPCGPDTRGWVKLPVAHPIQPDLLRHQAGSDGGQRNSAPGRARHKPSNHCAGNAGVLRLYLYARVRISLHLAHETAGAASTRHSLLPLGREEFQQSSGAVSVARTQAHIQSPSPVGDPVSQRR